MIIKRFDVDIISDGQRAVRSNASKARSWRAVSIVGKVLIDVLKHERNTLDLDGVELVAVMPQACQAAMSRNLLPETTGCRCTGNQGMCIVLCSQSKVISLD